MQLLMSLVVLILYVVAIIDALKSGMDTTKKIIWVIVIILVPIIGAILYFLIGKKKK